VFSLLEIPEKFDTRRCWWHVFTIFGTRHAEYTFY